MDCVRRSNRGWSKRNPERHRELARKWRQGNPDKAAEIKRRWAEKNPDKVHEWERERVARRSSRVRRIRKLLDHFEGRDAYLNHIAHAIDKRSDAQGLSWLCSRIDALIAERVYGEV